MKSYFTKIFLLIISLCSSIFAWGQTDSSSPELPAEKPDFMQWCKTHHAFDGLDVGVTLGSTGIGLDLKTPVTKWVDLRAGVDWLPRFSVPMSFNLNTYSDGMPTGNFNKVAEMLYDITGLKIDEKVNMRGKGHMLNFKFLVDVYPVPSNRHWHITAGFFAGTSKIAEAINTPGEKPTLVALNIYNRAYEYFTDPNTIDVPLGGSGFLPPNTVDELKERFARYGRMGIHIGDFKNGEPYIMEPAPDGTISAKAIVTHFKPYLGVGYSTDLDRMGKWHFGVDLGCMFWGGAPDVYNYDYARNRVINFTKDLVNIRGKVGSYMKIVKAMPVYPVLAVRFSYSIF